MAVNFGILAQTPTIGERYAEGLQLARAEQERNMLRAMQVQQMQAQQQNMLAQRQEREAAAAERRRATEMQNALAAYSQSGQPMTPEALAQFGAPGLALAKTLREEQNAQLDRQIKTLDYASRRLAGANEKTYPAIRSELSSFNPQFAAALPAEYDAEAVMSLARQGMSLKDQIESATRQTVVAPGATLVQGGRPIYTAPVKPPEPKLLTPEEEAQRIRIARESRPPAQPREPGAPVAVVDEVTGRVKYVPREEAIGKTPATAIEGLTPKERQQREAKFPQATSALKAFENTSDTLIKDLETLANHPGLSSITGIAAGRLPGVTPQGREAQALYDKIMARGGFQELQNMRQASPTGGALGNVSNAEGERLQAAFAALDRRQDAPSVRKAIRDAIAQTRNAKQNIRDAYDLTYEYKQQGGTAPAAKPAAAPDIDALLNKYR